MPEVTDPKLIDELNRRYQSKQKKMTEETDEDTIRQLNQKYALMKNQSFENPPAMELELNQGQQPQTKGFSGILEDIENSISNAPGNIWESLKALPGQAMESGKQVYNDPIRALENIGAGALTGAKGLYNLPLKAGEYLGEKEIPYFKQLLPLYKGAQIGETGLQKAVLGEEKPGDAFIQAISAFSPYAKLGGLGKGLKGVTRRAASAAAYSGGQGEDPILGALMGLTGEAGGKAIDLGRNVQKLRPSEMISTPLGPEELQQALETTKGTETGLGGVIENPMLQRLQENVLPNLPFSGANQSAQRTASLVTKNGEKLLGEMKGGNESGDVGAQLQEALRKSEKETRGIKTANFEKVNKAAEEAGLSTNRGNLRLQAKLALDQMKSDPDMALLSDAQTKSFLESIANGDKSGKYSLKNTDVLRGKLGDKAHDAYMANNTELSNIYSGLKKAADKDITETINQSGNSHIKELRDKAMQHYKEHYAPFEEPDIRKFTKEGGDPDLLVNAFLRTSKVADRAKLFQKLSSKLSDSDRKLLSYSYFSRAITDGKLNPLKVKTLYNQLGERQRQALLGDKLSKEMKKYTSLVEKNTDPLNVMFNPKTGNRSLLENALMGLLGAGGGMAIGSIPATVAGAALPMALGRMATKALTNPKTREKLVRKIIENKKNPRAEKQDIGPLIQALMASQSGGQ